jgi:hypothetical protein
MNRFIGKVVIKKQTFGTMCAAIVQIDESNI